MSKQKDNFTDLLKAIGETAEDAENLSKQTGTDDQTIQAAATGSDDDKDKGDGKTDPDLAKSLTVTNADGTQEQGIDATELLKALQEQADGTDDVLAKAMGSISGVLKHQNEVIKSQGEMLKSMNARLTELGGQGRGRKAVITALDLPGVGGDMHKSQQEEGSGLTVKDFVLKANAAFDDGKITGQELRTIDVSARNNFPIDPGLITKVTKATA